VGECMTYSIGFKAPESLGLVREVLVRYLDRSLEDESLESVLYSDATQKDTDEPGLIPKTLQNFALQHMKQVLSNREEFMRSLGEYLSEPKDHVWFDAKAELDGPETLTAWLKESPHEALTVSSKTQLLYDESTVFINGESMVASGLEGDILRKLANQRFLLPKDLNALSRKSSARLRQMVDLLGTWLEDGWVELGE